MKGSIKKAVYTGVTAVFLFTTGGYFVDYSKKWVNNKVQSAITQYEQQDKKWTKQNLEESVSQYENKDQQWTDKSLKEWIGKYEKKDKQWTEQTFETKLPLEQITEAYDSAYLILNEFQFKTLTGEPVEAPPATGSGIMLKGGYILTARHVTRPDIPDVIPHPLYGAVKKSGNKLFISRETPNVPNKLGKEIQKWEVEEIIVCS